MLKQKNKKVDNYSLRSSPMIKGKAVELKDAISEINKILKTSSSIHIDGMDCDISSINEALRFAEKKKCSINHKNYEKINNFYISLQKFGGSLVSFNELKISPEAQPTSKILQFFRLAFSRGYLMDG